MTYDGTHLLLGKVCGRCNGERYISAPPSEGPEEVSPCDSPGCNAGYKWLLLDATRGVKSWSYSQYWHWSYNAQPDQTLKDFADVIVNLHVTNKMSIENYKVLKAPKSFDITSEKVKEIFLEQKKTQHLPGGE